MTNIKLYVEGGGNSREQHARCREGFRKLLEKAGFLGRMPRIIAGGGRRNTFDQFRTAIHNAKQNEYPILLVDSEDAINGNMTSWEHLKARDNWDCPYGAASDQVQLMVTCMETWIMADKTALLTYFGQCIVEDQLFPINNLEIRNRHDIQDALVAATHSCKKTYRKGDRSFEILAELNPKILIVHLPHFAAFITSLDRHL